MRALYRLLTGVLLASCGAASVAGQDADAAAASTAASSAPQELQRRVDEARGADCARVCMQAAYQTVENVQKLFEKGELKAAHNAIEVALGYVRRAVDCSVETGKSEKATEINLRRLIGRAKEVSETLDSENRPHLTQSLTALEEQRDRLLQAMFGLAAGGGVAGKNP